MARYAVEAEVTVETNIEVDGNIEEPTSTDISNFDSGYFSGSETVEDTCTISFVWEPSETYEDNSEAEDAIGEQLEGNLSLYSQDGIEWEVTDVTVLSCEREEMSLDAAKEVLRTFLSGLDNIPDEVKEAVEVVLDNVR
jgi:hypothetical protein